jgi:methionyl aminopeptidase
MITIKKPEEIEIMKEGGRRHAAILREVAKMIAPDVSTQALEDKARELILEMSKEDKEKDIASFLNYTPKGAKRKYPSALCVSINSEVVHGIPNEPDADGNEKILKEGDIVTIDLGLTHKKLITDSAVTLAVGEIGEKEKKLILHTQEALALGIKAAKGGGHVGDIGFAIESFAKPLGYGIAEGLAGHGVGYKVHEEPFVPNEGRPGKGELLRPGMVIAIEPMLTLGTSKTVLDRDGYTYKTADGSISAHAEQTVVITEGEAIVLTK